MWSLTLPPRSPPTPSTAAIGKKRNSNPFLDSSRAPWTRLQRGPQSLPYVPFAFSRPGNCLRESRSPRPRGTAAARGWVGGFRGGKNGLGEGVVEGKRKKKKRHASGSLASCSSCRFHPRRPGGVISPPSIFLATTCPPHPPTTRTHSPHQLRISGL